MHILVFAIIVLIVAFLLIFAWDNVPSVPPAVHVVVRIAIILVAAIVIAQRAGLI